MYETVFRLSCYKTSIPKANLQRKVKKINNLSLAKYLYLFKTTVMLRLSIIDMHAIFNLTQNVEDI